MHVNNLTLQDLVKIGIYGTKEIIYNPDYNILFQEEIRLGLIGYEKGILTRNGAIAVDTGIFTGRSPKDKYIVYDNLTCNTLWWNGTNNFKNDNHALSTNNWNILKKCCTNQLSRKRLFVVDAFCGADKDTRLKVRFIMEIAWQAHFVKNMFIRPNALELLNFIPDFIVLNAAKCTNPDWKNQKLHSENFIAFNLTEKMQIIGGTWYAGEMKKGLFAIMNYLLPPQGIASMHCSANMGALGDVALFFGLSGTGKTTLSTDTNRQLIGDDEHGWNDDGVFNFEGGCYAKVINLSIEKEPEIYNAIRKNALLENVVIKNDGNIDFTDNSKTENTRVSYPICHIKNIVKPISKAGHPKYIIFLSADAFGVLPAISKLTPMQTQYYFLSGFTAKIGGTELGITHPIPTFSACFGEAFLTLSPIKYSEILLQRINKVGAQSYLVNTGWDGQGNRISLNNTRIIINAILCGEVEEAETEILPIFNLKIPLCLKHIERNILDPRQTWCDILSWQISARKLAKSFITNFEKYIDNDLAKTLVKAGPQL